MEDEDRYTRITLRIPKDLHAKLQEASDRTAKSMNAEIIDRVERSFADLDHTEALQAILRMERSKIAVELDLEIAKRQLIHFATIFRVIDAQFRSSAEEYPTPDLLRVFDRGRDAANDIFHASSSPGYLQDFDTKISQMKEIQLKLKDDSVTTSPNPKK